MKICKGCLVEKFLEDFEISNQCSDGRAGKCKDCRKLRRQERISLGQDSESVLRSKALAILGNKCVRCGFDDPRALQIDHVNGGGWQERKSPGYNRRQVERKVVQGNTIDYQLLCANCNWIKRSENGETNFYRFPG